MFKSKYIHQIVGILVSSKILHGVWEY